MDNLSDFDKIGRRLMNQQSDIDRIQKEMADFQRVRQHLDGIRDIDREIQRFREVQQEIDRVQRTRAQLPSFDFEAVKRHISDFEAFQRRTSYEDGLSRHLRETDKIYYDLQKEVQNFSRFQLDDIQQKAALAFSVKEREITRLLESTFESRNRLNAVDVIPKQFYDQSFWGSINSLKGSFLNDLTVSMRDAVADSDNGEEAIAKIGALVEGKLAELPQNAFAREALWKIVIGVLGFVLTLYASALSTYQLFDSKKSADEQRITSERILELLQRIADNTEKGTEEETAVYYIVDRGVEVKARPSFKSETVGFIPRNVKVQHLQSNHKWLFITYFDSIDVSPRFGWVNKKYLKRVK